MSKMTIAEIIKVLVKDGYSPSGPVCESLEEIEQASSQQAALLKEQAEQAANQHVLLVKEQARTYIERAAREMNPRIRAAYLADAEREGLI